MVRPFNFRLDVGHLLWPLLLAGSLQAAVVVTVHPAARQLQGGGTCTLAWEVTGTDNKALNFQVVEGAAGGTVDAHGTYTAPRVPAARSFHVRGTSQADPTASAQADIYVLPDRVEVQLPGRDTPGDVADLTAKLFGEDLFRGGHSERLPFWDLSSEKRFGDPRAKVAAWTPDEATAQARKSGDRYDAEREGRFFVGYGQPFTLHWAPMPGAEGQTLSWRSGFEVTRLDVTGLRSQPLRLEDAVQECTVESLAAGKDPLTWLSDLQHLLIQVRGVVPLAGSLRGNAGHEQGVGSSARFRTPAGMAYLPHRGLIAMADPDAHCVWLVNPDGVSRVLCGLDGAAGDQNGTLAEARFRRPTHLAATLDPAGAGAGPTSPYCLYVVDSGSHAIRWVRASGRVETLAGVPGTAGFRDGPAREALFRDPQGITVLRDGSVLVADAGNHRLRRITPPGPEDGSQVETWAGTGAEGADDGALLAATFTRPGDLCYAALEEDRDSVFVTDGHAVRECRIDVPGVTTRFGSVATAGYRNKHGIPDTEDQQPGALRNVPCLDRPTSLAIWEHYVLVLDAGHRAVRSFDLWNGTLTTVTGPPPPPEGKPFIPAPETPAFRYGLPTDGILEPLPPGFTFAELGDPRALCLIPSLDPTLFPRLVLATEHRLATLSRGMEFSGTDPALGTMLKVEPIPVRTERKRAQAEAEAAPRDPGPWQVTFSIPEVEHWRREFTYVIQFVDANGEVAHVDSGQCVANQEVVVRGKFTRAGKAKVLLTWVTNHGNCSSVSVDVQVH